MAEPLIKLTHIGNPDVLDGQPTPLYLDPGAITTIYQAKAAWYKNLPRKNSLEPLECHEPVLCSCIQIFSGHHFNVIETPEEIATMRDKALGYDPAA